MRDPDVGRGSVRHLFGCALVCGVAIVIVSLVASILSSVSRRAAEKPVAPRHRDIPDGWKRYTVPGGWIYERQNAHGPSSLVVFVPRPAEYAVEKTEVK